MPVDGEVTGTDRVPVRGLLPLGAAKFTVMVQVPPAVTVVPEQVSAPLLNAAGEPFVTTAVPNVTGDVPVTVIVTRFAWAPLSLPKARPVAESVAPVPVTVVVPVNDARIGSVSVAELLTAFGSVTVPGAVTVALLARLPVAVALTVPVAVKMTELPLARVPSVRLMVAFVLLAVPLHAAAAVPGPGAQLQLQLGIDAGLVSATTAPLAGLGPLFVTTIE